MKQTVSLEHTEPIPPRPVVYLVWNCDWCVYSQARIKDGCFQVFSSKRAAQREARMTEGEMFSLVLQTPRTTE